MLQGRGEQLGSYEFCKLQVSIHKYQVYNTHSFSEYHIAQARGINKISINKHKQNIQLSPLSSPQKTPIPSNRSTPSTPLNHPTRSLVNCSTRGLNFVSCNEKSSTVPSLRKLTPGNASPTRYMRVPQVLQKKFVIFLPETGVFSWPHCLRLLWPRRCLRNL